MLRRIVIILLVAVATTLLSASLLYAEEKTVAGETDVYLKIGDYYILYTKPAAPFLDKKHRLLVPLRSIEDLMGGSVNYDSGSKTATVNWLHHTFKLTINSTSAVVDGEPYVLDTVPILKSGSMFLPVRLFLDQANIGHEWIEELGILHIADERVMKGEAFKNFEGNDSTVGHTEAFHIQSYQVSNNRISIRATNISGDDIPAGKADIQPLVQFTDDGFSVDSYTRPNNPDLPEVKQNETITVSKKIGLSNIAYIISVGRKKP